MPRARAGGVVTLLFTDLVGSTRALTRLGDDAAEELRRTHFSLLREAVAESDGEEVPYVGRRLAPSVAATGLVDLGVEALAFVRAGGSGPAQLFARSVMRRRDQVIARGALSADEFDTLLAALADPAFSFVDALSFAAWGRRPS